MERIHDDQKVFTTGKNLEDADRAVVMLHGRGASARSMLQLAEKLPEAAYLAPQASSRTWYPNSFMEPREKNQPHLDSALRKVESVVNEAAESVVLAKRRAAWIFAGRVPGVRVRRLQS